MPEYQQWWHHEVIAEALDRWEQGKCPRLMIFTPPQVGKSELVTRRLPAYCLGRNPGLKILACSHSADLARAMNRDVQRIIDSELYRDLFPDTEIAQTSGKKYRRTLDYFEVMEHGGFLRSAGVGKRIAGYPAQRGIIDDPFGTRADAESRTIRDSVWNWFTTDFSNRLSKDAPIVIVHTRWNLDDLAGRLIARMAEKDSDPWQIISLPSLHTGISTHSCDPRQMGQALWPAHKDEHDLVVLKAQNPRDFEALHQQNPLASGSEWPPEWFGPDVWFDQWPDSKEGSKVIALDDSKGVGGRFGDYSAFVKMQWHDGLFYIEADMANDRNVVDIGDRAVELQQAFRAQMFGVEEEFGKTVLAEYLDQHGQEAKVLMPLVLVSSQRIKKEARIQRLGPFLARQKFRFKLGSLGTQLLVQQLREFPNAEHDDGPDAAEMALRLFTETGLGL